MIKNYIKIAFRNLRRYKGYTIINITGLTLGITCSCLLLLFVNNELSYDTFHSNSESIYRIIEKVPEDGSIRYIARTAGPIGPAIKDEINDIVNQTRVIQPFGHLDIKWKGERLTERGWSFVDSTFFDVFTFQFIEGDPKTALDEPNAVVITETIAKKYFGNSSALGKILEFDRIAPVAITGVIKDMPSTSHLQLEVIASQNSGMNDSRWWKPYLESKDRYVVASTYLQLSSPNKLAAVSDQIPSFITKVYGENPNERDFYLQSIEDIYLNSEHIEFDIADRKGDIFIIYIFAAVAIFIIIIACINYINLATARSVERSREIGIRKVVGAIRGQLIGQFLSESIIVSIISFFISIGLVDILLPYFNEIIGSDLLLEAGSFWPIVLVLFVLAVVIGIASGSYPALYLSKLRPSETLKGEVKTGSGFLLRKALVITQFSLSIVMIVATLVVTQQMNYISDKKLGFDKDNMLVIDINSRDVRSRFEAMKTEFGKIPEVENVAVSSRVPGEWKGLVETYIKPSDNVAIDSIQTYFICFGDKMLDTYNLPLIDGKNFTGNIAQDSLYVMLNETAASLLIPEGANVIGSQIKFTGVEYPFTVIGLVKDFHFQSLHENISPLVMGAWSNPVQSIDYFSLKLKAGVDITQVIKAANEVHEKFDNQTAMEYHFLDQQLQLFYEADQRAGQIFTLGAGLTIFIACLGLFGLASFMVRKKTKEVSVRKVLGASSIQLFMLLSKTFFVQIIIASLIAVPLSWYMMSNWLDYFAYRVDLNLLIYLIAGGVALLIALLTTSYHSIKATRLNPAQTLKNE